MSNTPTPPEYVTLQLTAPAPSLPATRAAMAQEALLLLYRLRGPALGGPAPPGAPPQTTCSHLCWLLENVQRNAYTHPVDKLGRWLGYVQGVLAAQGSLSVPQERERSRQVYHAAYRADGVHTPPSANPPPP